MQSHDTSILFIVSSEQSERSIPMLEEYGSWNGHLEARANVYRDQQRPDPITVSIDAISELGEIQDSLASNPKHFSIFGRIDDGQTATLGDPQVSASFTFESIALPVIPQGQSIAFSVNVGVNLRALIDRPIHARPLTKLQLLPLVEIKAMLARNNVCSEVF